MMTLLRRLPPLSGILNLFTKDESSLPTETFKDRLATGGLRRYRLGTTFGAIRYGNTAIRFAWAIRQAVQAGLFYDFVAFVPKRLSAWNLGPSGKGSILSGERIQEFLTSGSFRLTPALGVPLASIGIGNSSPCIVDVP
jgi:hypothetical protein